MMIRWPGVIKPGSVCNEIIDQLDWFPTLCTAAGIPNVRAQMAKGMTANGKQFKVHLDGYDFVPYFKGAVQKGPRKQKFYFDQGGNLNAIRWNDWKLSFAQNDGNIAFGTRKVTSWALITNLRMDPYERAMEEGGQYIQWYAQQMWLLVPIQQQVKNFFADFNEYPYQVGSSLNAAGINYGMLQKEAALKQLKDLETLKPQ